MKAGAVGRRYAKALLDLATEQGQLDKVGRDLAALAEAWAASRELREVFENPAVPADQRKKVIEALAQRMMLAPTLKNTLLLLSDRRRLQHLPEVAEAFHQLAEEKGGRLRAEVITASVMPEQYFVQLQRTLESVTGKNVVLVRKQDASLIGGVVTRVGDKVFDGSLKTRLEELKDGLLAT